MFLFQAFLRFGHSLPDDLRGLYAVKRSIVNKEEIAISPNMAVEFNFPKRHDQIPTVNEASHESPMRLEVKESLGVQRSSEDHLLASKTAKTRRKCSSSNPPTNIVFIKVHKSGSTTVSNLLARYALSHDLNIALPEQQPKGSVFHCFGPFQKSRVMPLAEGQTFHVLFNHMFYNRSALDSVMPKDAFYVAIMRQPEERFLSGAYYFRVLKPPLRNNTDNKSFKNFISQPNRRKLEKNFRLYNSVLWNTGLVLSQQSNVTAVEHIRTLDKELDLMLVMEHMHESLVLFRRWACLTFRDIVFVKTNTRKNYLVHEITAADRQQLRDWQKGDHMVYDHFYAKFWEAIRQEGDSFYKEVEHFRDVTNRVSHYCGNRNMQRNSLLISKSEWNEEFSITAQDCQLMTKDERELQKSLLIRAKQRRDQAGYQERRKVIPKWGPDC